MPTLRIPIKDNEQLNLIYEAEDMLSKAGITFDVGTAVMDGKATYRFWSLDWSLKGAKIKE